MYSDTIYYDDFKEVTPRDIVIKAWCTELEQPEKFVIKMVFDPIELEQLQFDFMEE